MRRTLKLSLLTCLILLVGMLVFTACDDANQVEQTTTAAVEETTPAPHVHTEKIDRAVAPTCIKTGLTEGRHCSICNEVLKKQEIVKATGHSFGKWTQTQAPTCTEKGSERRDCDVCNRYETRKINANGHIESEFVVDVASTIYSAGSQHTYCTVCNRNIQTNVVIPRIVSNGLAYEVNSDGTTCTITGIGTCTDTEIGIPDTIDGYKVTAIGENAFGNCSSITDIALSANISTINRRAFYKCTGITEIRIPSNVNHIGAQIFLGCENLTTLYYNSSYAPPEGGTFVKNEGLKKIVFGDNLTNIPDYICYNCDNLEEIILSKNTKYIGNYAFYYCTSVEKINLPNGLINTGWYAFYEMNITEIIIPDGVESIYNSFRGCRKLEKIVLPASVISAPSQTFYLCCSLKEVYYTGNELEWSAISISEDSSILKEATVYFYSENKPIDTSHQYWHYVDGVPTVWHVHSYATEVTAPTATTNGLATHTCTCGDSYTETIVPTDFTVTYSNYAMVGFTGETGENLVIPAVFEYAGTWYKVVSIDGSAFSGHTKLTSITIPNSVQSIGSYAFYNCLGLTGITIPNSVTSIGNNAFKACRKLTSITIPNNLTSIGEGVFSGCSKLTSITIPNGVTSIGNYAFSGCSSLTSITIPNSVQNIGESVFSDCISLTIVYYGGTSADWVKIGIGSYGNTNLTIATRYYYSETQPTDTINQYWHYVYGMPTKWEI